MGFFSKLFGLQKPGKKRSNFNTTLRKTNRGLRSATRTIKKLNKPFHAPGAPRGRKY